MDCRPLIERSTPIGVVRIGSVIERKYPDGKIIGTVIGLSARGGQFLVLRHDGMGHDGLECRNQYYNGPEKSRLWYVNPAGDGVVIHGPADDQWVLGAWYMFNGRLLQCIEKIPREMYCCKTKEWSQDVEVLFACNPSGEEIKLVAPATPLGAIYAPVVASDNVAERFRMLPENIFDDPMGTPVPTRESRKTFGSSAPLVFPSITKRSIWIPQGFEPQFDDDDDDDEMW